MRPKFEAVKLKVEAFVVARDCWNMLGMVVWVVVFVWGDAVVREAQVRRV